MQRKRRDPIAFARPAGAYWLIAIILLIIDQVTKWLVRANYEPGETSVVIPGVFEFVRVGNEGAAFGMLPGRQIVFILTSIAFLVGVAFVWYRYRPKAWPVVTGLALVSTGAVGNLIDRVLIGSVTDFIYFKPIDFPVFNVADICITVGVIILVLCVFFAPESSSSEA